MAIAQNGRFAGRVDGKAIAEISAVSSMVYSLSESLLTRAIASSNSFWFDTRMTLDSAADADIGTKQNIVISVRIRIAVLFSFISPEDVALIFRNLDPPVTLQDEQPEGERKGGKQGGEHHRADGKVSFVPHALCHDKAADGGGRTAHHQCRHQQVIPEP